MSENISASKILAQFKRGRKGVSSHLFLKRLNRLEQRKREQSKIKLQAFEEVQKLFSTGAKFERRYNVARVGGFEGGFFDFFRQPEVGEASFQKGLGLLQEDPSLFRETVGPTVGQKFLEFIFPKKGVKNG